MTLALCTAIAIGFYAVARWRTDQRWTNPDSRWYLAMASGSLAPVPYSRRYLLPALLGSSMRRWKLVTAASLIASGVLVGQYAGRTQAEQLLATAFFCGLCGWSINVLFPVLVDAPAFALAIGSALAMQRGYWWLAVPLAMLSGACKESAPIFAAIFAWHPLPLVGLVAAGWLRKSCPPPRGEPWLAKPIEHARKARDVMDWKPMLLPLGALPVLAAWGWEWTRLGLVAAVAVVAAFGQMATATDSARMSFWCVPALIPMALGAPDAAVAIGVVLTPFVSATWRGV